MNRTLATKQPRARKTRRGFSLVELIVVILIIAILAAAAFVAGASGLNKANVSQTTSNLHNFSVAVEAYMNSNPGLANIATGTGETAPDIEAIIKSLNNDLDPTYAITTDKLVTGGNMKASVSDTVHFAYASAKTDAWKNPFYIIFDAAERTGADNSDYFITIISAGADAKLDLDNIGKDDIFVLVQYTNGSVSSITYDMKSADFGAGITSYVSGVAGADAAKCPVNHTGTPATP